MRLICPNCEAQYEVDAAMIPSEGRDVQCSSCGHTWFQPPQTEASDEPAEVSDTPPVEPDSEPALPDPSETSASDADDADDDDALDAPMPGAARPRPLDDTTRGILREEAERETAARRRDSGLTDPEGDTGPGPKARTVYRPDTGQETSAAAQLRAEAAKTRSSRWRAAAGDQAEADIAGDMASPDGGTAPDKAGKADKPRDALPDIDALNSSLTGTREREPDMTAATPALATHRGFGLGFASVIAVMAVLALIYAFAPQIIAAVPPLETAMQAYVSAVNGLLQAVDGAVGWAMSLGGGAPS